MTAEQKHYQKFKYILELWEAGKIIQSRPHHEMPETPWKAYTSASMPDISDSFIIWRPKPTPQFGPSNVPPGSYLKKNTWKDSTWAAVISVADRGIWYYMGQGYCVTWDMLNDPDKGYSLYDKDGKLIAGK
jgi:hypothetical protein